MDLSRYTESERTRVEFLRKCAAHAPEMLSTLESIMPLYMTWLGELESLRDIDRAELVFLPESLSACANIGFVSNQLHSFLITLCAWAQRWNFSDAWCFDEALSTLALWHLNHHKSSDWSYKLQIGSVAFEYAPELDIRNILGLSFEFDAQTDTARSYREKILTIFRDCIDEVDFEEKFAERFEEAFDAYCARIKADSQAPTVSKHNSEHHFEWLIDYQIKGREVSDIANTASSNGVDHKTVRDAISRITSDIGLTLRKPKAKPGRPPRS